MTSQTRALICVGSGMLQLFVCAGLGLLDVWSASGTVAGAIIAYFLYGAFNKESKDQ